MLLHKCLHPPWQYYLVHCKNKVFFVTSFKDEGAQFKWLGAELRRK
jgi:hypothetical protein